MTRNTRIWVGAMVAGAVALGSGRAEAQPVRPNILFIFDTSTSMLDPQGTSGKDGSPLCGDMGQASRIFRLKQAIRNTLAEVGTDEANFGLARFPERVTPAIDRGCFRGHYINSIDPANGCKTSEPNETADGAWFTQAIGEEFVVVPVTKNFTPVAADYDPQGGNVVSVHGWLDNIETSNGTIMTNPEIRSGGPGTPLASSLFYTRLYFTKYVKLPADPRGGCRKNIAILVTDGEESCAAAGVAATRAGELYNAGVEVYVVVQQGEAANEHDAIASSGSGGKRPQSIKVDFTDPAATKAVLLGIIAESVPPSEICNGADDNCNGLVDEAPLPGVGGDCLCPGLTDAMVGKGMCKKGMLVCKNGGITCEGCVLPGTELCNGLDDNCNDDVDEGFNLGQSCDNGQKGACKRLGNTVCKPDGTGVICDAPQGTPTTEICNNIDDDCNGLVDDGPLPGNDEPCGADLGVCMAGKTKCDAGKFICVGSKLSGTAEVCNALDDNCNGLIDEGLTGIGDVCACTPYTLATLMKGECRPGMKVCKGREPLDCEGCVAPRKEICDGKDNNCDGVIDEDNPCDAGRACVAGKCEIACKDGEFRCPPGYYCDDKVKPELCRSLKCANVTCPEGWMCDEGSGKCKDLCEGVVCDAPKTCREGRCQDCYTLGCSVPGEMCISGKCKANPCTGKTCETNQYCDETGECVGSCHPGCKPGERCISGSCQGDPCATVNTCTETQVCDPAVGECKTDLCKISGKSCPGQRCIATTGQCKDDPCAISTGPGGCYKCRVSDDGLALWEIQKECAPTTQVIEVRGGGCSCSLTGQPARQSGPGLAVFLLGLVALRRRRAVVSRRESVFNPPQQT